LISVLSPVLSPEKNEVVFAYRVVWQKSNVAWASRWDIYLKMNDVQIHWFAICNSVAIVLFLSGMCVCMLVCTRARVF